MVTPSLQRCVPDQRRDAAPPTKLQPPHVTHSSRITSDASRTRSIPLAPGYTCGSFLTSVTANNGRVSCAAHHFISCHCGHDAGRQTCACGALIYTNNFPRGPNEHLRATRDLGGKRHSKIEFGSCAEIAVDVEGDPGSGAPSACSRTEHVTFSFPTTPSSSRRCGTLSGCI